MSKKRSSTESSHDEQTTKDSDGELTQGVFQNEEDNTKRAKLTSLSDTTLGDLPVELIHGILVMAVALEVKGMRMIKRLWKEKADQVISRLRTVSLQWNSILSTDFFLDEVHRTLDCFGPSELPPYNDDDDDDDDDDNEMSKKRTSTESSHEEQTTKDSDGELTQAVFQNEEDNTKRAKLSSLSDTTLEDLPMELFVCILVKAVAMEVKGMRLAKSVWKEKAELVISRLRTVSLKWSSVLSTDFFRNELHRTLDGFAQETLRWEVVLHQPPTQSVQSHIMSLTTMRDEVFVLFIQQGGHYVLNVYDRNNVAQPKDIIPIPEFHMGDMAACSLSNCIYLLSEENLDLSVIRVWKDEHQFKVSTWIKNLGLPVVHVHPNIGLSIAANGNLVVRTMQYSPEPSVVGIYDANGLEQHKIILFPDTFGIRYVSSAIQKVDGNLVLTFSDNVSEAKLLEIDTHGGIIREYQSSDVGAGFECFEDIYGRILVNYSSYRIELLDSEFNLMDTAEPQLDDGQELDIWHLQYNSDRHEMVGFRHDWNLSTYADFATLRFTDE